MGHLTSQPIPAHFFKYEPYRKLAFLMSVMAMGLAIMLWIPPIQSLMMTFLSSHGLGVVQGLLPLITMALAAFAFYALLEIGREMIVVNNISIIGDEPRLISLTGPFNRANAIVFVGGMLALVGFVPLMFFHGMSYLAVLPVLAQGALLIGAALVLSFLTTWVTMDVALACKIVEPAAMLALLPSVPPLSEPDAAPGAALDSHQPRL